MFYHIKLFLPLRINSKVYHYHHYYVCSSFFPCYRALIVPQSLRYKAFYQEYNGKHKTRSPAPHGTYIPLEGKNSIFLITLNKMSVNCFDKW